MDYAKHICMRILAGLAIGFLLQSNAYSQEVEFSASVNPSAIRVGDQMNLIYTSNEQVSDLKVPDLDDFEFLGGPSQGHSQSITSVQGKITTTSTYQYTYFYRAVREGNFTIPAATARIKDKEYRSNTVSVEVIAGRSQPQQSGRPGENNQDVNASEIGNELFIRLIPDKTEVFLGEQITVTIKLFTHVDLSGIDYNFKGPDFTGFYMESIEVPVLRRLDSEVYNDDIYGTGVIRKAVIIPQRTGEIVIQPFDLTVTERREVRRESDPWFDEFFFPSVENVNRILTSQPVTIRVKQLPGDVPDSFTGAVGKFRLSATLSDTEAVINEPLTLRYTIAGTGNIKLTDEPLLDIPSGIEKYDPVINTKMDNALSGSKTFEYLLIPQAAGTFVIPSTALTYFDTEEQRYSTLFAPSFTVEVLQGEWDSLALAPSGVVKEDIQMLNQDIHFIKTKLKHLEKKSTYFAGSVLHHVLMGASLLIFLILLLLRDRWKAYSADAVMLKNRKASKYARKRLKACHELLKQENYIQFYDVLLSALWRYLSDKLNIPLAKLSRETAENNLRKMEASDEVIGEFFRITGECEIARYAPSTGNEGSMSLYQDALEIISRLQQELKDYKNHNRRK